MKMQTGKIHPAAEWAASQCFNASDIDCTTAVVLKILDGKCKMLPGEKAAIMEIYDVVRVSKSVLFNDDSHECITNARGNSDLLVRAHIHELRVYAESKIPKPVMKKYKAMLRDGLFG